MTEHPSKTKIERFCISGLPEEQLVTVADHVAACETCHRELADALRLQRGTEGITFTLAPEFWLRHEHLDYERLVEVAEHRLDATDREIVNIHLNVCPICREDVRNFLAFRKQIEPELLVRYGPGPQKPAQRDVELSSWRRRLVWRPAYAAATVILIGIALAVAAFVLKHRMNTLEASKTPSPLISPEPTPSSEQARTTPSPVSSPSGTESASNGPAPTTAPRSKEAGNNPAPPIDTPATVIALNDGRNKVTLDKSGNINGIDNAPSETRRDVADALRAERIEQPSIWSDLTPGNSSLRGIGTGGAPFRLLSPARTVVIESRPVFKWEELTGASSYRIYVLDSKGQILSKSEVPSTIREWKSNAPIDRGKIYSWVVVAIVDGKEVVSPGPAAPEIKFQVLSASNLQKIVQLKQTHSHLALGIFYAKVGLLTEAESEFQELARFNPNVQVATRLLRSAQLIRCTLR